jgi:chemotaxis protein MotA
MNRNKAIIILGILVIASAGALISGATSIWIVSLSGFFFVIGGTLFTTVISENFDRILTAIHSVPRLFQEQPLGLGRDRETLFQTAEAYRRGSVHQAEYTTRQILDPFLRQGAQLIIDRCSRGELERTLLWRISNLKEEEKKRLRILQTMSGFAPAFGMLGTLFGLVRLLFSLGDSGLEQAGAAMGFAMITTVYGLVAANLFIKPVTIKLEHRIREQLALQYVKYELLMMMHGRENPRLMHESLEGFLSSSGNMQQQAQPPVAAVGLARV